MFCRNCGKEVSGNAKICMECGSDPKGSGGYCFSCGSTVHATAVSCPKCGAQFTRSSSSKKGPLDKPSTITIAAVLMLVGALLNLLAIAGYSVYIGLIALGSYGLGLLCCFIIILPIICMIFEIIGGIKLLGSEPTTNYFWIGILEIVTGVFTFNIIVLGLGIANIVLLVTGDAKVYFDAKKG